MMKETVSCRSKTRLGITLGFIFSLLVPGLFSACASFPLDLPENSGWTGTIENPRGSVRIASVSAERTGEWSSLEKEISGLLPLLFSEESYRVVSGNADYSAEVHVREREYADGWRTKRSLSVEIRLWAGDASGPLPLSAGRSVRQGKQSFASSKTLSAMLRAAVKNAVAGVN